MLTVDIIRKFILPSCELAHKVDVHGMLKGRRLEHMLTIKIENII